ncbi:filamentous hemagglutinin [Halopseudomonas yangmingensis]|uniref:Filamentous hemagglutinin n=1 Tax=Halopseudomonas yangmingensis TaxID=1720063 RepID=A0A1I4UR31_9GAMM|nr:filamentous hemagglutinin [Halopseudomonas yangmingensis]
MGLRAAPRRWRKLALLGGSLEDNLQAALTSQLQHLLQASVFNAVGDYAQATNLEDGTAGKVALHALVGGMLSEATGGDFATGALAAGANEALIEQLSGVIKGDKSLELAVSQLIGIAAATVTGGDYAKAAELAKNATAYNRQLHPSERELAKRLAEASEGKYTQEEIEEQMRLAGIRGTEIHSATDIVATQDGIYDPGGNWVPLGDSHFVQVYGKANPEVIAYIKSNIDLYEWSHYAETGFDRYVKQDWDGVASGAERDRLTGYALDENGGYRVPVVVDGVVHHPRFHQCGGAECIFVGANIDFSDPATLSWIRAADADYIDRTAKAIALAGAVGPSSVVATASFGSTGLGLLSSYLSEDIGVGLSSAAIGEGFVRYSVSRGLSIEAANRINNSINFVDGWGVLLERVLE